MLAKFITRNQHPLSNEIHLFIRAASKMSQKCLWDCSANLTTHLS